MNTKITESYRLQFGYGELTDFTSREQFAETIERCTESDAETYLSEKWNYGKLLSIFKTIPFKVVVVSLYGTLSQAAEEWEQSCTNKFFWFRTPYFQFHKDGEVGDDTAAYQQFITSEARKFRLLAEKFVRMYRRELKDYLKILCNDYGPHVAFESFNECVKKCGLTPSIVDTWRFKIADTIWCYKHRVQFLFKRKKHETYNDYCLRQSPIYRRIYDITRQLDEWDKQMKKGYSF